MDDEPQLREQTHKVENEKTSYLVLLLGSVLLQVVEELLGLLGQLPPLSLPLFLQSLLCFFTLVHLHPREGQTQQQCLQGQDVKQEGDIVQNLGTDWTY